MFDRPIPPYPSDGWDWCPQHSAWYPAGEDCPDCRCDECPADHGLPCPDCDWEPDDVVGLGPEISDGWYRDLIARADFRHDGWRD